MRTTRLLPLLALAAATVACKGASVRPTANAPLRELPGPDVDQCFKAAKGMNPGLGREDAPGKLSVFMVVDADGAVPVAFVHDQTNMDSSQMQHCLTDKAVGAKFEGEGTDYLRPHPLSFKGLANQALDIKEAGKLDEKLAQDTLTFADWASQTDRCWGFYYVHKYADAIAACREALKAKPDDVRAMRGLAVALADSGGDLKEAKEIADKAIAAKDSEATHEAALHVCVAQKDDECMFDQFTKATKSDKKEVTARSYELAQLQDKVKEASERLQQSEEKKAKEEQEKAKAEAQKHQDPTGCGKFPEGEERTACFVKYCFAEGAQAYAKELKPLTGQDYEAGEWKTGKGKGGATEVTVQIRPAGAKKKKAAGGQPHDATWSVDVGDNVNMKPLTIDANNISAKHNACRK